MRRNSLRSIVILISSMVLLFVASSCRSQATTEIPLLETQDSLATFTVQAPKSTQKSEGGVLIKLTASNVANIETIDQVQIRNVNGLIWTGSGGVSTLSTDESIVNYSLVDMRLKEGEQIATQQSYFLTVNRDGSIIGWTDSENQVFVSDSDLLSDPLLIKHEFPAITGLVLSSDGAFIVLAAHNQAIEIRNTQTGSDLYSFIADVWLTDLSLSPDDAILAGVHSPEFKIYFFDINTGEVINTLVWEEGVSPGLSGVYFSPDWSTVAWVAGGAVQLMDVESGVLGVQLLHQDAVGSVSWSADGSMIATSSMILDGDVFSPVVTIWDSVGGEMIVSMKQEAPILDLSFSPNQTYFGVLDIEEMFTLGAVRN